MKLGSCYVQKKKKKKKENGKLNGVGLTKDRKSQIIWLL